MILHDPHALHRKWWNREWTPTIGDDAWTDWDFILAEVYQVIQDYTNPSNGAWMPDDTSGDVYWDVHSMFSGYDAAVEAERDNRKELEPGERLYAVAVYDEAKPKPTLMSMMNDLEDNKNDLRPTELKDARPPTPAELEAMMNSQ